MQDPMVDEGTLDVGPKGGGKEERVFFFFFVSSNEEEGGLYSSGGENMNGMSFNEG